MTAPKIGSQVISLSVQAIEVTDRIRPTSEVGVAALDFVIAEHGFTVPILVRKLRSGYRLIDGAHRLAAVKKRGINEIAAVVVECMDDEARVLETSQNLAGAALSPLEDAMFLAAYSEAYGNLHPETRRGAAGALARHGAASELSSFAEVIAEKRSITPRQVRKIAAAGRLITKADAIHLRSGPRKVTLKDIQDFGKIDDREDRTRVIRRFIEGDVKSIAEARVKLGAETGVEAPAKDPVEAAFNALKSAWSRAPEAAKRRFVEDMEPQLSMRMIAIRDARLINGKLGLPEDDAKGEQVRAAKGKKMGGGK